VTVMIPTGDLVGVLSDVLPFASTDAEIPSINCVRVEWDGDMFHALTTDMIRLAWASWHPDDEPDGDAQDDLFTQWGASDDPWSIVLPFTDARDLAKTFKLGAKEQRVPLSLDCDGAQLKVVRHRDTGHSAITMAVQGQSEMPPDVRKVLSENDAVEAIRGLAFGAKFLADFAKVRARGPLELTFTGVTKPALVRVGSRFTGAIMPTRVGDERERVEVSA
jgi:hypothetical protein